MKEQTERDEYSCKLTVDNNAFITDEVDHGCGGVIIFTED